MELDLLNIWLRIQKLLYIFDKFAIMWISIDALCYNNS